MTRTSFLDLRCHPATPTHVVRGIQVSVERTTQAELRLVYRLEGDIASIRVPPLSVPLIGHELWRHTCFEAFTRIDGQTAYHEFNLAPSREWTIYELSDYRIGTPLTDASMDPRIVVRSIDDRFELDATIRLEQLSELHRAAALRVGLAAVIETTEGIAYWALRHPTPQPDFHHNESFALIIPPPGPDR